MFPARLFITIVLLVSSFLATAGAWTPNAQEIDIANRMASASGQQREFLQFDPILAQVARERAMDLAERHYFSHTNPDGHGVNYLVRKAGYVLPGGYPSDGNNLESIAAGGVTAGTTWSDWMGSPDHKTHLLGEEAFFAEQTSYGVGFYEDPNAPYRFYWVVITAPPMPQTARVEIASPAEGALVMEGAVVVAGISVDSAAVQISVENAGGSSAWTTVAGTQRWSTSLRNLMPGANTVRVRGLDASGGVLAQAARALQYLVVRPLTIRVAGQGSVGEFSGTTQRRVGSPYTITATPAAGWLFSGWSGSWIGSEARANVAMREGLEATATFVQNPFVARRGMYHGWVESPDGRRYLRVALNAFGKVTGRLLYAGREYAVGGQFRLNGRATIRLPRPNAAPLVLVLDMTGAGAQLGATILDDSATTSLPLVPAA